MIKAININLSRREGMNVFNIDGRFYRILDKITDFLLLNLLWIIFCLPIVTIFPSTAAMFGVVRSWVRKDEPSITKHFYTLFKDNFKQGILIEIAWFFMAAIVTFNIFVSFHMGDTLKYIIFPPLIFIGILFVFTSIFLFPIMVHYKTSWLGLIKNAFFFSISQPVTSLLGILIIGISGVLIFFIPISFFAIASLIAYILYYLCNKAFQKVETIKSK
ncbi:DUF624 domain-containing protein [Bacillus sp. SAJ1]|nr:DUF624 domain-containing protein [Bacillus sp. SAJ1]